MFGWLKKNGKEIERLSVLPVTDAVELSDGIHAQIKDLCTQGDHHAVEVLGGFRSAARASNKVGGGNLDLDGDR
jgi:hypothetical protein